VGTVIYILLKSQIIATPWHRGVDGYD